MVKTRRIMIRAETLAKAKRFADTIYSKSGDNKYLPEKVMSVKLSKRSGLAGGIKGWTVVYRQKLDTRPRKKSWVLYKSYQGRKPRL